MNDFEFILRNDQFTLSLVFVVKLQDQKRCMYVTMHAAKLVFVQQNQHFHQLFASLIAFGALMRHRDLG